MNGISYVATANVVIVYYDAKLTFLFADTVKTPCIISLAEWLNQGGE